MTGRLKTKGNIMLATKLDAVLKVSPDFKMRVLTHVHSRAQPLKQSSNPEYKINYCIHYMSQLVVCVHGILSLSICQWSGVMRLWNVDEITWKRKQDEMLHEKNDS